MTVAASGLEFGPRKRWYDSKATTTSGHSSPACEAPGTDGDCPRAPQVDTPSATRRAGRRLASWTLAGWHTSSMFPI